MSSFFCFHIIVVGRVDGRLERDRKFARNTVLCDTPMEEERGGILKEKRYFISDAAKELEVESHVLRYWEKELNLEIPKNEMGHRYYREEEMEMLKCVKELKARGFHLKTIRHILTELQMGEGQAVDTLRSIQKEELEEEEYEKQQEKLEQEKNSPVDYEERKENVIPIRTDTYPAHSKMQEQKLVEFEDIMRRIVGHAMKENSHILGEEIGEQVTEKVVKEMDYLMRLQEEREEKHFQSLDNMIRQTQRSKKEAAAMKMTVKPVKRKRKSAFFKKRKRRTI